MWIDAVALGLLAVFVISGAIRGALASALAVAVLVGAYASAILLGPGFAQAFADGLQVPKLLATALSGAAIFLAAFVSLGLVSALLRWGERRRRAGAPRGVGDRALGAFFGGLRGGLIALLVGVLGYWLQAFETLGGRTGIPALGPSNVAAASQSLVAAATTVWTDPDSAGGRMAARAAAYPSQTFGALQDLLEDERILGLRDDARFWTAVEAGNVGAATGRVSFARIAYDEGLRRRFADTGLVPEAAASDPEAFRFAVSGALEEAGPRIRGLREDPEVQRLAEDPEVQRLVQSGDTLGLLRHPGFRKLVDRVTGG
jgi:membrane protein required for colicin V production